MISRMILSGAALLFAFSLSLTPQPAAAAACGTDTDGCDRGQICQNKECVADVWGGYSEDDTGARTVDEAKIKDATGLGDADPRTIAARVINVLLGFLGIIAVILILAGGFMWMTAAGNDDKIGTAKKIMTAGVVGLVIVLAAFGIAQFVVNALVQATTT